ncbi:hypothetical protein [Asticcacaulis sp. EMRT-3]|uniref:hypothetical protein n=1 Tax=Asticcacaulis sp. EMRT-3 TaxID=3040349 RepID=UPI0024AF48FB|nr:hypothetical protein [Asticcacaulis sp. EMRT-3]MDI7776589.1 hypothetical protein [Asticcacaulis sp. EMRT-3]
MADYESPTIIQPIIPNADMTPLERLLLTEIFTGEPEGDGLYFFAEQSTNDMPEFDSSDLRAALQASEGHESQAAEFVREQLAKAAPEDISITLDMSIISWEYLFQDIVRRSSTLTYVTAISAYTCSKMRTDGFGGVAVLITANEVRGKNLDDVLADMLDEAEANGEIPAGVS